jgi:hypothetical protein
MVFDYLRMTKNHVPIAPYRSVIVEYYETLEADADHLGEILSKQLAILRKVFAML